MKAYEIYEQSSNMSVRENVSKLYVYKFRHNV